jgi:hypothetical protein
MMNSINFPHGRGTVVPLCLRLIHDRGDVREGTLSIPVRGAGMAGAIELGGERLNDEQWRAAEQCRIAWHDGSGWQLSCGSAVLACVLNGKRVTPGRPVAIAPGDALELGSLRFMVEDREVSAAQPAQPAPVPSIAAGAEAAAAQRAIDADAAFDLRDLALPVDGESALDASQHPFAVLDIAGALAWPTADPLSGLLGEAGLAPDVSSARRADLKRAAAHDAAAASQAPASAADQRAASRTAGADGSRRVDPATALLAELHGEFVRVVRDPTQLAGHADWEGFLAPDEESAPTLEKLSQEAETYPLLRDILLPREPIDAVIKEFAALGTSNVLKAEETEDVLRLFAPEIARNARVPIPSLTRREHHALSPDSYIQIGSARSGDDGPKQ